MLASQSIWLFATPWTVALQASLSMKFSRQEYWSGFPFSSPGKSGTGRRVWPQRPNTNSQWDWKETKRSFMRAEPRQKRVSRCREQSMELTQPWSNCLLDTGLLEGGWVSFARTGLASIFKLTFSQSKGMLVYTILREVEKALSNIHFFDELSIPHLLL